MIGDLVEKIQEFSLPNHQSPITNYMKYLYTIICLFSSLVLQAQDPRFAQFYTAPTQLNPALNVVYEGQLRLSLIHI